MPNVFTSSTRAFGGVFYSRKSRTRQAVESAMLTHCRCTRARYGRCTGARVRLCTGEVQQVIDRVRPLPQAERHAALRHRLSVLHNDDRFHEAVRATVVDETVLVGLDDLLGDGA